VVAALTRGWFGYLVVGAELGLFMAGLTIILNALRVGDHLLECRQ